MSMTLGVHTTVANHFSNVLTSGALTPQVSGSTFVLFVAIGPAITSVVDSVGNTYVQKSTTQLFGFGSDSLICYACENAVGAAGMTWTVNLGGNGTAEFFLIEIATGAGSGTYPTLDAVGGASASQTFTPPTTATGSSVTTVTVNDFLVSCIVAAMSTPAVGATVTDTTGWNAMLDTQTDGTNFYPGGTSWKSATTATAYADIYTYGGTSQQNAASIALAYKQFAAAPPTAAIAWVS